MSKPKQCPCCGGRTEGCGTVAHPYSSVFPKGYVFASDPKSYHNDPAQQHGAIAEDQLRNKTIDKNRRVDA